MIGGSFVAQLAEFVVKKIEAVKSAVQKDKRTGGQKRENVFGMRRAFEFVWSDGLWQYCKTSLEFLNQIFHTK